MTDVASPPLELEDIQAGALFERPSPYVGAYLLLHIGDRADGRELVRRLHRVASTSNASDRTETTVTVALTYRGLEALGVPQTSLDSFAPAFRQGMAARAALLGDVGESSPEQWERPLGSAEVHVAIAVLSGDDAGLRAAVEEARRAYADLPGLHGGLETGLLPAPDRKDVFRVQGRHRPARGRGKRQAVHESPGGAAQSRRDHPGLPGRDGRAATDAGAGDPRPQRHLCRLPQAAHEGGGVPTLPPRTRRRPRRRRTCSAQRSSDVGRAVPRSPSRRIATSPISVPMPGATTTSPSPTIPGASSARWAPTPGVPTHATPWTTTAAWTSGCTG